jgi:hypothetical protein
MSQGLGTQVRHAAPPQRWVPVIVDHHNRIFPREGHHVVSAQVFLGFLVPGERPRGHEILHHATVLELLLEGVCVVQAGLLEESLRVVCRQPCLVLATACGGHDALQVRAVRFLVIIVIVSHDRNPLRAPFSHLLATLGALLGISDGGVGWCRFAATGDRFPPTWDRDRVNSILAGGILGGDAE